MADRGKGPHRPGGDSFPSPDPGETRRLVGHPPPRNPEDISDQIGRSAGLTPAPGDEVSHYRVLEELGRGGMGVVYRAADLVLGREVALKTLHPDKGVDADRRRRFLREARAASKLSHPGIVSVYEAFEARGLPWIAMELVEGRSLRQRLDDEGTPPIREVIAIAETLADALAAAHRKGVLHRDIKPSNVLMGADDNAPRLSDFGLARFLVDAGETTVSVVEGEQLTAEGVLVGTPAHMPPETVLGRPPDRRSDIYALGTVLYELCTGRQTISGYSGNAIIDRILHHEPVPIESLNPNTPEALAAVVHRCLERDADDRYQDANELLADLRLLRQQSESNVTISLPTFSSRRRRASRLLRGLGIVTLVAVGIAIALLIAGQLLRSDALPTFRARQLTVGAGLEAQAAISPDGKEVAYVAETAGNADVWLVDRRGGSALRLTEHEARDESPCWYPDGSAIAFSSSRDGTTDVYRVTRLGGGPTLIVPDADDPAISADGERIAFTRRGDSGYPRVWTARVDDPSSARQLSSSDHGAWEHEDPEWSPGGDLIAYHTQHEIWVVDVESGETRPLTRNATRDRSPVFAPDGRHLYFTSGREDTLAIWRVKTDGSDAERVTLGVGREQEPSLSADGRHMTYNTETLAWTLELIDLETGSRQRLEDAREILLPRFSQDGTRMVFNLVRDKNTDVFIQDLVDGQPRGEPRRLTELPGPCTRPSFSADGSLVAFFRVLEGQRDLWVVPSRGGLPRQLTDHPATDMYPEFSPVGSRLAFVSDRSGSSQIWVCDLADGEASGEPVRVSEGFDAALLPSWSPDGRQLAFIGERDGEWAVWTIEVDGERRSRKVMNADGVRQAVWRQDDGRILVLGSWDHQGLELRSVPPDGGEATRLRDSSPSTAHTNVIEFSISPDGRLLAYSLHENRGDVWVLDAERGSF